MGSNEEGEIWIHGATVMKGYRDNPGATAAVIDSDGWFHTGDVGCYDNEGWIYVRDRIKELIKYNALQVRKVGKFRRRLRRRTSKVQEK